MNAFPPGLAAALAPLQTALPLAQAMTALVVTAAPLPEHVALVERVLSEPALAGRAALAAGLWLYIDDLDRSHRISQALHTPIGSVWHGVMHRREGDFSNSLYWFGQPGASRLYEQVVGERPDRLVRDAERAGPASAADLADRQRREWSALLRHSWEQA